SPRPAVPRGIGPGGPLPTRLLPAPPGGPYGRQRPGPGGLVIGRGGSVPTRARPWHRARFGGLAPPVVGSDAAARAAAYVVSALGRGEPTGAAMVASSRRRTDTARVGTEVAAGAAGGGGR